MEIILLGLLVGVISWNLTKEYVFGALREFVNLHRNRLFNTEVTSRTGKVYGSLQHLTGFRRVLLDKGGYLFLCDYCLAHWVALVVVVIFRPEPLAFAGALGWVVTWATVLIVAVSWTTLFGILRGLKNKVGQ